MAQQPNILFLLTDQQRFDSLGCNGAPICRTPAVDEIAATGMRLRTPTPKSRSVHRHAGRYLLDSIRTIMGSFQTWATSTACLRIRSSTNRHIQHSYGRQGIG